MKMRLMEWFRYEARRRCLSEAAVRKRYQRGYYPGAQVERKNGRVLWLLDVERLERRRDWGCRP